MQDVVIITTIATIAFGISEKDNGIRNGVNGLSMAVGDGYMYSKIHVEESGKSRTCHLA